MQIFRGIDAGSLLEACDWIDRHENNEVDEAEFAAWSRIPANTEAWIAVNEFESFFEARKALTEYLQRVESTQGISNGAKMAPEEIDHGPKKDRRGQFDRRAVLLAAAGLAGVGALGSWGLIANGREMAETGVGERKKIDLPDGNQLNLNTDTKVFWKVDERTRKLWLERGEVALVAVTAGLPFSVTNGTSVLSVANADCNMRRVGTTLSVTVMRGQITFDNRKLRPESVAAGNQLQVSPSNVQLRLIDSGEMDRAGLWQQGLVSFDGKDLGDAISEYNRYLKRKIVIRDPDLVGIRILAPGPWSTEDPTEFLDALSASFDIKVYRKADLIELRK